MNQTYHLEALAPDTTGGPPRVVQRISMRSDAMQRVEQRAVRLLQRSQAPHWNSGPVEAVRVIDGGGAELFRWTVWDEMSKSTAR